MCFSLRRCAFTLLEVMLAAGLLSLLLLMHLAIFQSGMSGWQKVEAQGSLLQQLQVSGARWVQSCTQASGSCVDLDTEAMALLSPLTDSQSATTDPVSGQIVWRATRLFYRDSATQEFRQRTLKWSTPRQNPLTIEEVDFGSGLQSMGFYRSGGHVLGRNVQLAQFSRQGSCWQLLLRAAQKRYGREQLERVEVRFLAIPRNL